MRNGIIATILLACLSFAGCDSSLTPEQIQAWSGQIAGISEKIDGYQDATTTAVDKLADAGLLDEATKAQVYKISGEIDRVQPALASISTAIAAAEITSEKDIQQWIELARAANQGSAPVNPYAPYIDLGLGGLASVAAYFAARKAKDAKTAEAKYAAHKAGVERANLDLPIESVKVVYDYIGDARAKLGVQ